MHQNPVVVGEAASDAGTVTNGLRGDNDASPRPGAPRGRRKVASAAGTGV